MITSKIKSQRHLDEVLEEIQDVLTNITGSRQVHYESACYAYLNGAIRQLTGARTHKGETDYRED